jgi:hypothetical protein
MTMETTDCSALDQLNRMYAERKISQQEYERLCQSLQTDRTRSGEENQPAETISGLPWQVWLNIGVMAVSSLITLLSIVKQPIIVPVCVVVDWLLIYGLWNKRRWAFIVCVSVRLISILLIFRHPEGVLLNLVLAGILLTAYPYFFGKKKDMKNE